MTLSGEVFGVGFGAGFSGGLITGVFAPVCGGGATISASPVGGGLNTLGSSVGVGAGGLAGLASGAGVVAGGVAGAAVVAQALFPTAIAMIAAVTRIRMAHLINVLRPHISLYAAMMAKPC